MVSKHTKKWAFYKQQFLQHELGHVAQSATNLLRTLVTLPEYDQKDRQGGVLVLASDTSCTSHVAVLIGKIPKNDPMKYYETALNKCLVLQLHQDSLSSFSHRDGKQVFGGGIAFEVKWERKLKIVPFMWNASFTAFTGRAFIAFSGLPELADEALMLVLAIDMEWLGTNQAKNIARASNNPYFGPLLKASRQ